jgi:hypothetical protein
LELRSEHFCGMGGIFVYKSFVTQIERTIR